MSANVITTMFWDNVDPAIRAVQRDVFQHLGFRIDQEDATGQSHGDWMDRRLEQLDDEDAVLFVDIDCFPLNAAVVARAFAAAREGRILGCAQTANHKANNQLIYAAPCFLSFSVATWKRLNRTSLKSSDEVDAAMGLTLAAREHDVPVELIFPTFVCRPKWPLAAVGAFGFGTFYAGDIFHLYQSRHNKQYEFSFKYVADCVLQDRPIDYIDLFKRMNSTSKLFEGKLRGVPGYVKRVLGAK